MVRGLRSLKIALKKKLEKKIYFENRNPEFLSCKQETTT